jgi:UDP-glucose 4-epimerase
MKVVIFGGSGFLGSHVADVFTEVGDEVVVFDREKSKYLNHTQRMVIGDIIDEVGVNKAMEGCDVVYNFAGIADIEEANKNPLETVKYNVIGNTVILEASRRQKIKRFVYASSLYVYSKMGGFYRSTKQACELLIDNYNEVFGLPYTIVRYGSLYGPRADEKNFIYKIINQAFKEGKIVREGDGEELREYINVYDAARHSVDILSEEYKNQHIIITGNQQMKVKDLLSMIKEILDNKVEIEYVTPTNNSHYEISPYTFAPKLAKRIVSKTYVDLGQGILELMRSLHKEQNPDLVCREV